MKKLNYNEIKFVMVLLMTLDSLSCFFPSNLIVLYNAMSKIAVGWFAFGAAEGVVHTSDIKRYNIRLYVAAAVMLLGNIILNTGFGMSKTPLYENAFLTIALGVSAMTVFETMGRANRKMNLFRLLAGSVLAICGFLCQYGYIMIPVMLCSYYLRENLKKRDYVLIAISMMLLLSDLIAGGTVSDIADRIIANCNFLYVLVIPFIHLYSGEKGSKSKVIKYFFYVYYPLHIWVIATITNLVY